ncbi:LPS assembly lipoprotein LptE [Maricaulis salignorans]|uniref:LPS-assembly lipoprotein n=1 Tax=Maricaulis salignorans TaxID=144026 RepID=A0A1G9R652_9PROT|nr:LPS assembly lipoprotein LptE [Maricaulis salignorans]SDM17905.1 LPS-assembly lipoprotein [Maricaulis salignorans]
MRPLRLALSALLLIASAGLSACGFAPMYGANGVSSELADIRVETGRERVDFRLQEALLDGMGARSASGPYTIRATTSVTSTPFGVGADAIASRYALRITVNWQLYRDGSVDPVMTGVARSDASYDVPTGVYGALASEADAEDRAINIAADRIITQLARAMQDGQAW